MLLMTRTVFGAAEAGAFPTLSRALSRWFPMHERSRANGIMWMGARSGGALAPPIAVAIITLIGWRYAFAVFGLAGLIWCAVCVFWYREEPADHGSVNGEELRLIRLGAAPPPQAGESVPWKTLLLNPTMIALFCSYFASGFGFQFFVTWLPTYLMREHGLTLQRSGVSGGAALGSGSGWMPDGRGDCRLDHTPHGKRNHRAAQRGCERLSTGSGGLCGRHVRTLGGSGDRISGAGQWSA